VGLRTPLSAWKEEKELVHVVFTAARQLVEGIEDRTDACGSSTPISRYLRSNGRTSITSTSHRGKQGVGIQQNAKLDFAACAVKMVSDDTYLIKCVATSRLGIGQFLGLMIAILVAVAAVASSGNNTTAST
jgi:hypothetical protein